MSHLLGIYQTIKGSMCGDTSFFFVGFGYTSFYRLTFGDLTIGWQILLSFVWFATKTEVSANLLWNYQTIKRSISKTNEKGSVNHTIEM